MAKLKDTTIQGVLQVSGTAKASNPLVATDLTTKKYVDDEIFALETSVNDKLDGKQATLISGTNVKTVVGNSILGGGNITLANMGLGNVANTADNTKNVLSATKLTTARTIGGVSFDGTANINLPGVNTAGNQNTTGSAATLTTARTLTIKDADETNSGTGVTFNGGSNITIKLPATIKATIIGPATSAGTAGFATLADKLANARTIGGVSFDGSANINLPGVNTAGNQNTTGNAGSATKLATARTIGGVSFNGTANIDLPGVNTAGNQSTTGNAGSATTLQTARTIALGTGAVGTATSFNGSSNITIPVTGVSESYLTWGGKDFSGSYGPIDAAMVPELGALRTAFLNASKIAVEYSTNSGTSWSDYEASPEAKVNLFNGNSSSFVIGKNTNASIADKSPFMLRVTIDQSGSGLYTVLNKFIIYLGSNTSSGSYCFIDGAKNSAPTTFVNLKPSTSISGWSGYNVLNHSGITFGSGADQYRFLRFTFGCTGGSASANYYGLTIYKILGYGGVGWSTPSNLARSSNIYSYNYLQEVTFPAKVTAPTFVGALTGTATSATKLATARTIGGVSFDGTANINLPGVNTSGTQNTSGNAATATTLQTTRTLTIGNTGKNFDGSAKVAWTLAEIGAAPTAGSSSITTLGTIGTGTWQGSIINSTYGGMGVNNGGRTLKINTNSGTLAFSSASKTLTVANTASISGTNTGDQTTITGNAGSATTLQTARTLTIGSTGKTFNGGADVAWTLAEIGAQSTANIRTTWADPTNTTYPSAKLVKDTIDNLVIGTVTTVDGGNII